MFGKSKNNNTANEQELRAHLTSLSEKELLIEMLIELKKLGDKCDDIARKIVIFSN